MCLNYLGLKTTKNTKGLSCLMKSAFGKPALSCLELTSACFSYNAERLALHCGFTSRQFLFINCFKVKAKRVFLPPTPNLSLLVVKKDQPRTCSSSSLCHCTRWSKVPASSVCFLRPKKSLALCKWERGEQYSINRCVVVRIYQLSCKALPCGPLL